MDVRQKMINDIFDVLMNPNAKHNINRDNKNQYCKDHAIEKAKMIENSLYRNCNNLENEYDWKKLYNEIDVQVLVDKVETKTVKCRYKKKLNN